ncbi:MAG: dihydrolipoamide acetyltransferase family protein [Lentisphaeria bacterium]
MATPVLMPKQGNTVEECLLAKWRKKKGATVAAGEIIADIETDKASFEIEAPVAGTLLDTFFDEGVLVPVQVAICAIGNAGEDVSAFRSDGAAAPAETAAPAAPAAVAPAPAAAPAPVPAAPAADRPLSPRARKFVAEHPFVVPAALAGTGAGGRIVEADVKAAYAESARLSPVAAAMQAAGIAAPATGTGVGGMVRGADMGQAAPAPVAAKAGAAAEQTEGVPLPQIRKIIASRLHESLQTMAQYTLNACADASALLAIRKRVKENAEKLGLADISINDMVNYAAIKALKLHPAINAEFIDGKVYTRAAVNFGFACDTPKGLMVLVIRNAQELTLNELAMKTKAMAKSAQEGKINPDDLVGGSFTVSNLGMFGITSFTPVINAPQVAILGVCGTELKPVRRKTGEVVFAEHIGFSLTLNHQIIDGAPGAKFLKTLRGIIENFDLVCMAG